MIIAGTFCRSDFSSLAKLSKPPINLVVSGSHLDKNYGETVKEIEEEGIEIFKKIDAPIRTDSSSGLSASLSDILMGFSKLFEETNCSLFLCVGDRIELIPAVTAALINKIPVGHISGGDVTFGSLDNQLRHAVSKMSHIHFVSMEEHKDRLIRMGEEPSRIHVTGDPALDRIKDVQESNEFDDPIYLVTYHPDSLVKDKPDISPLLQALETLSGTIIITAPNPDINRSEILRQIKDFKKGTFIENLGQKRLYSLMKRAVCMIGNSSSGIWEAPSFKLPVVNIGNRQEGRKRAGNVIDVPLEKIAIIDGIKRATSKEFRDSLKEIINPYGDGNASERILKALDNLPQFKKYETY